MKQISIFVLAMCAAVLPCMAQSFGTITENGVAMEVKSATVLFDVSEPKLRVVLLPFEPTAEELAKLQSGDTGWILSKESPDPKKWPDRCPQSYMELSWKTEKSTVGDPKTAYFYLFSYGIGPKLISLNVNDFGKNINMTLTGPLKVGQEITLTSKGTQTLMGDKLDWNLNVKKKILAMTKK
jgi:hypothetical protein